MNTYKKDCFKGLKISLPMVIGYIPIAIAFGVLSKNTGTTLLECVLFSALVFAGASQFMALNLISLGTGGSEIVLTTFLLNFRHFLMSASLAPRLHKSAKKWRALIGFGITDETFSAASFQEGQLGTGLVLTIQIMAYLAWVGGSGIGYLVEGLLPPLLRESTGIALYAMFAAFLIPEAKKARHVLFLSLGAGLINWMLNYINILSDGWNIVLAIIFTSSIGVMMTKSKEKEEAEVFE